MNLGFNLLGSKDLLDYTLFIDKISGPEYTDSPMAAGHLFSPSAKLLKYSGFRIRNQRKLKALGSSELLLRSLLVPADADNAVAHTLKFLLMRLK